MDVWEGGRRERGRKMDDAWMSGWMLEWMDGWEGRRRERGRKMDEWMDA